MHLRQDSPDDYICCHTPILLDKNKPTSTTGQTYLKTNIMFTTGYKHAAGMQVRQSLPWNVQSGNASFASATVFFTSLSCQKLMISVVLLSRIILSLQEQ